LREADTMAAWIFFVFSSKYMGKTTTVYSNRKIRFNLISISNNKAIKLNFSCGKHDSN
jgi:hypothetical protein